MVWGSLHGVFLILLRLSGRSWRLPATLGWAVTMGATFLAWLAFYETRSDALWLKLITTFTPHSYNVTALRSMLGTLAGGDGFVLAALFMLALATLGLEWRSIRRHNEPYLLLRRPLVLGLLVVLIVLLAPGRNNAFIYFAF